MRKLGEKRTRLVKQDVVFKVRRTSCSYFIRSHFGLSTRFVDLVGLFWFHGFLTGWWFLMEHQLSIVRVICSQLHRLTVQDLFDLLRAVISELQSRIFIPPTPVPLDSTDVDSDLEADLQL